MFCWALALHCAAALAQMPSNDTHGLWDQAVLYRDEWGVPHVYADNPRAMAFAFGYAQAEDHIERMLIAYRIANGRAAEIFGDEMAAADEFAIKLGHAELAWHAYEMADGITRDLCEGFALGVNTWLTEHPDQAPAWAEGVHPADILALMHRYLLSQAPFDYPDAHHLLPSTPSANAWAVAPSRSASGDPMLVMNPHVSYDNAQQWYEAHLVTQGLNMYGATLFGLPVILQGHNGRLGWALAPNQPDIADLFIEMPQPGPQRNPKSMMADIRNPRPTGINFTENELRPYYVWSPKGFVQHSVRRLQTPRGPVVALANGYNLSWHVGGYEDFGALRQLYDMGRAQDLDAFRRALDRQQLSSFHVVYADASGNVFYQYNAKTGQRRDPRLAAGATVYANAGTDPAELFEHPLSTQDAAFAWGDILPPNALPWLLNPQGGYVQACGTPPWLATSPSPIGAAAWPAWLVRDVDTYRAKRVRTLFSLGRRSFADMQAMLFDTVAPLAAEAAPFLLRTAEAHPDYVANAHPDLQVGLDMLSEWNYLAEPGSMAMTYFHVWWSILRLDERGNPWPNEIIHRLIQENAPWFQEHALQSASEAAKLLRNEYQTMNVPWGEVHVIRRGDRTEGIGGASSGGPIFYADDQHFGGGKWHVNQGYGFAMVVRFGDQPYAVSLTPFGTSENPDSPHFDDQLDLLLHRRFKVTRYQRGDIERHAESARGMRIRLQSLRQDGTVLVQSDRPMRARLAESASAPAELPSGTAAFTTYVEPIVEEGQGPVQIDVELGVPPTVCAPDDFESLYVFGYHPVLGWHQVEVQGIDPARRTLTARVNQSEVLAVLGPESALLGRPGERTRVAHTGMSASGGPRGEHPSAATAQPGPLRAPGVHLDKPLSGREVTGVARNDDADVPAVSQEEEQRVARLFPPQPERPNEETPEPTRPSNIRGGTFPVITPALPPGFRPDRDLAPPPAFAPNGGPVTPAQPNPNWRPSGSRPPVQEEPLPAFEPTFDEAPPAEPGNAPPEPDRESAWANSTAAAPEQGQSRQPEQPAGDGQEPPPAEHVEPARTQVAQRPPDAVKPGAEPGVTWSDQTPSEMFGGHARARSGFDLAPNPAQASEMRIGTELELRTPDGAALFIVRTKQPVRAQAYLRRTSPAPYPAGLTAKTAVYEVAADPASASGNTALTIRVAPQNVNTQSFDACRLYVYDVEQGWIPLAGQRRDGGALSFSAIDFGMRTYVVLGPE